MTKVTYGEAYLIAKSSLVMIKGIWTIKQNPNHLERMNRKDAIKYYNKKLNRYWHLTLDCETNNFNEKKKIIEMIKTNSIKYRLFCFNIKNKQKEK